MPISQETAAPAAIESNDNGRIYTNGRTIDNYEPDTPPPQERKQDAWYDLDAEYHLAATLMVYPEHLDDVLAVVTVDDLSARGAAILAAVVDLARSGDRYDAGTVALRAGDPSLTKILDARVGTPASWRPFAEHLSDLARRRRLAHSALALVESCRLGDDSGIERAREHIGLASATATADALPHPLLREFLDVDEPDFDWLIDGLLERGDRVLVTGPEGGGKSTLLRQVGVQAAAGVHPFTLDAIEPLTVLLVDLENSTRFLRRQLGPLDLAANRKAERLHVVSFPQGLDMTDPDDRRAFCAVVDQVRPDLLVGGPLYKFVGGDPTEEGPAKAASMILDQLRVRHGFALCLEAHQPHESGGKRPERPYGASLWKRWPEFGLHLAQHVSNVSALRHWRGDRDVRSWPAALQRGGEWPWTMAADRAATFAKLLDEVKTAGRKLPYRELADRLGVSKSHVERLVDVNRSQWDAVVAELDDIEF